MALINIKLLILVLACVSQVMMMMREGNDIEIPNVVKDDDAADDVLS